jgi:hypothetical protein
MRYEAIILESFAVAPERKIGFCRTCDVSEELARKVGSGRSLEIVKAEDMA